MPYNAKYVSGYGSRSMHRQLLNSVPTTPVGTRTPPRLVLVPALHDNHALTPDDGWLERNFLWVFPIGLVIFLVASAVVMVF